MKVEGLIKTAEETVVRLSRSQKKLSVAESCTGGLIGKTLTDIPGSSAVFLRRFHSIQQ